MNVSMLMKDGAVVAFFPFHDEKRRKLLFERWIKKYAPPGAQPVDDIKASQRKGYYIDVSDCCTFVCARRARNS